MRKLSFVKWYGRTAVYLDGLLIHHGEISYSFPMLQALGFECEQLFEIDTGLPSEYDRDSVGWWKPPKQLGILLEQRAAHQVRARRERIALLENELVRLKREEKVSTL